MPEHLKLDNTILSGDPDEIAMTNTGIKYTVSGENNDGSKYSVECKHMFNCKEEQWAQSLWIWDKKRLQECI